jgi:hypothetical protein
VESAWKRTNPFLAIEQLHESIHESRQPLLGHFKLIQDRTYDSTILVEKFHREGRRTCMIDKVDKVLILADKLDIVLEGLVQGVDRLGSSIVDSRHFGYSQ